MTSQAADLELSLRKIQVPTIESAPTADGTSPAGGALALLNGLASGDAGTMITTTPQVVIAPAPVYTYAVEMRLSWPDSDVDTRVGVDQPIIINIDVVQLLAAGDPVSYARTLTSCLFSNETLHRAFVNALVAVQAKNMALRIRLLVDYAAPELLNLRWESLLHPDTGAKLFTGAQIYFSRYLVSRDWRPVQLLPKGNLHALVAVANPSDLASYKLAAIDVAGEISRASTGMAGINLTTLPADPASQADFCTLNRLVDCLRSGASDGSSYDVLFLVCHGAYIREESWLLFDDDSGSAARVPGADLVARISELENRPRLVVLASCQSAGVSAGQALTALGPRLAEAGVPAVIAMQGSVSMPTMETFLPVFFKELMQDGQIDRAMAVARGGVQNNADYWMPVLFMRLKSGRLWYTPGFGGDGAGFSSWDALVTNVRRGAATLILGNGMTDSLLGSAQQIAMAWADQYHYPMETHERDQLPQVAQYLTVQQRDINFPRYALREFLIQRAQARYSSLLPDALKTSDANLDDILDLAVQNRAKSLAAQACIEPFQFLASLPIAIYITTSPTNLLASALKAAGKDPKVVICPWNANLEMLVADTQPEDGWRPKPVNPLVYHLFGRFDIPESLVITEDDYFDFLIGVTKNDTLIPSYVRTALVNSTLLFVGFQLDSWDFRVFYRSIINQEGGGRRSRLVNVGVQVDQENGEIVDPDGARKYLENYFDTAAISLYWGGGEDFLQELSNRIKAKG